MSGYRPGYSEAHSPFWRAGHADGLRDAACERPENMNGPDPEKAGSVMYMRGYQAGLLNVKWPFEYTEDIAPKVRVR